MTMKEVRMNMRVSDVAGSETFVSDWSVNGSTNLECPSKLSLAGISKTFKTRKTNLLVLDDIFLEINPHEFLCVLGSSGCGKTTLLNIIAGLEESTEGEVKLDGRMVEGPSVSRCLVFQTPCLFPWLTVKENISLGLDIRGDNKNKDERIHYYIQLVGLGGFENYKPGQLSGGMAQRVGLARALINKPDILLLDEPFGALDHHTRTKMQDELLRIWEEEQCTAIFVTHDIEEAIYLGTKVVVMTPRPGKIPDVYDVPLTYPRVRNSREFLSFRSFVSGFFNG